MINVMKRTLLLALTLAYGTMAFAQQTSPVQAKLVVPSAKLLPGVPFDMWIEVTNPSDATVSVGLFPQMIVRTDRGDSFEIKPEANDAPVLLRSSRQDGDVPVSWLTLHPHATQTLTLPIQESLKGAQFFQDYRLSPPGKYTLAIRLTAMPNGFTVEPAPLTYLGSVVTAEASVERVEPTGSDAKVWKRMQEVSNGRWAVLPFSASTVGAAERVADAAKMWTAWSEIVAQYPDSNYVPYALLADAGNGDKYLKTLLDAINRFPSSPVAELLDLKAWSLTASSCGLPANAMGAVCDREWAKVNNSKRPTTRIRVFGREDVKDACPPDYDCEP